LKPGYGIEQEYIMMKDATEFKNPPSDGFPLHQGSSSFCIQLGVQGRGNGRPFLAGGRLSFRV